MMRRANGQATVPQIFVGSRHVGGNAELQRLDASGELEAVFEASSSAT
jgi:glutaredoxin 3